MVGMTGKALMANVVYFVMVSQSCMAGQNTLETQIAFTQEANEILFQKI